MTTPKPHNPDGLTDEQIGVAEGWRLLDEDEIIDSDQKTYGLAVKISKNNMWGNDRALWRGDSHKLTYRTKLSRAELRAARGLPPEDPICFCGKPLSDPVHKLLTPISLAHDFHPQPESEVKSCPHTAPLAEDTTTAASPAPVGSNAGESSDPTSPAKIPKASTPNCLACELRAQLEESNQQLVTLRKAYADLCNDVVGAGCKLIIRAQEMNSGERDVITDAFRNGPLFDGDVPSKSSCDTLLNEGFIAKVVVKGEAGFYACTYKGIAIYSLLEAIKRTS